MPGNWREINLALIAATAKLVGDLAVGVVAFDSRQATMGTASELAVAYGAAPVGELMLWPTNFDEHNSPRASLEMYASLVRQLAGAGKKPIASYGGFYAMMLSYLGMEGVSHGLGYGDKRDLEPIVGGGLPPARFYLRAVRDSIGMGELAVVAAGLSEDVFRRDVCDCVICDGLLRRGGVTHLITEFTKTETRRTPVRGLMEIATPRVYRMARFHFLENRGREIDEVRESASFDDLATGVLQRSVWAKAKLGAAAVAHLQRWVETARPNPLRDS